MVLMTLDHASGAFNAGRVAADGVSRWKVGSALPAEQFLTRWVTHLCAPTFVFLAGTALALSLHRRLAEGESPRGLDGFHLRRGLFIALLDPLWMSWILLAWGRWLLQVMYVLGVGTMCMVALRRLSARTLVGLGLLLIAGNEWISGVLTHGGSPSVPVALLFNVGYFEQNHFIIGYPLVPWLGMMCLGYAFGRRLLASRAGVARLLGASGVASLGLFLLVRGLNGYGNERLYREGDALLQWLHVSKYPPSLAYAALELGLMALLLAGFWWVQERWGEVKVLAPLRLLGQTALFFYLLHVHLLYGAAILLGVKKQLGLGATYGAAMAALGVLSVACAGYRRYKAAHPQGWTRYV
ncbi:hypothetical protein D187_001179 [Cystobacter fuscus DSM 2262]|uniref:Heparan-alpha-glucosaminide N-acetyltransferase catalytic domain-containing protein n=2 Tax=Cystobacter fuscus TaxID=43 RepID=S9PEA5_CYSF2|nr:hypothetical protein D187_001179 [Cystobacter fuscus DSM 2262]